jgi:nucleotide-binding universal stress UspA family protein
VNPLHTFDTSVARTPEVEMSNGRTILLAIRIGEASLGPGRTAAWLARDLGATVTVLYVAVELETVPAVSAGAGLDQEEVRQRIRGEARERADVLARHVLGDVPYDVMVGEGDVADEVAAVADRVGADLVVVGSQGRSAVRSVILGDTTRDILRRAHCPVVVVPPGVAEE